MLTTVSLLDALKADLGGISDYQAARRIGVSKATVSAWRSGTGSISDQNAHRIAELLRIPSMYVVACINVERLGTTGMHLEWRKAVVMHCDESVQRVSDLLEKERQRSRDGHLKAMAKELDTLATASGDDVDLRKAAKKLARMARRAGASILLVGLAVLGLSAPTPSEAYAASGGALRPTMYIMVNRLWKWLLGRPLATA